MSTVRRRLRFGTMTALLIGAATVSLVIINLLGARYSLAWDVTATQQLALAPRTRQLLAEVSAPGSSPYEIVVAADSRSTDRTARTQVGDVLAQFERAAPGIRVTGIDTATASGASEYVALLERLRDRDRPRIEAQVALVREALSEAERFAASLESLSPRLLIVRNALPEVDDVSRTQRKALELRGAQAQAEASKIREIAAASAPLLDRGLGRLAVPDVEAAAAPMRQLLTAMAPGLQQIATELREFTALENASGQARDAARPLVQAVLSLRDQAAILGERLRLERLDIARVSKVLESTPAALVIGPPEAGLTAIPLEWLFPGDGAGADLRRKAEELFTLAIESLARPINPIVVIVHGQPGAFLRAPEYQHLIERLGLRGIDVLEWAAVLDAEPPGTSQLRSAAQRPTVYVVLNTDTTQSSDQYTGPARAEALGRAIRWVVDRGHPLLLSVAPSEIPTFGQKDPTTSVLPLFGLESDSARPLMRNVISPQGTGIDVSWVGAAAPGEHPILGAVRNLRARFEWITPLRPVSGGAAHIDMLYEFAEPDAWAESQWGELWRTLRAGGQPPALPRNDSSRDDAPGPWTIAAAASRVDPASGRTQRLVAVGCNRWFEDSVTAAMEQSVDGRAVQAFPGNAELLEASIYWLAGQDERVAQSPTARAIAVIGPLGPGTRSALRWLILAGLPGVTLLAGVLWRAARG